MATFGPLLVPCPACGATITLPVEATTARADDSTPAATLTVAADPISEHVINDHPHQQEPTDVQVH